MHLKTKLDDENTDGIGPLRCGQGTGLDEEQQVKEEEDSHRDITDGCYSTTHYNT